MKFKSGYDEITKVECFKSVANIAKIPVPESCLIILTPKDSLLLSSVKHLSKKSLMTFMRKIEEKSFQYRDIEIKDKLNWLYQ